MTIYSRLNRIEYRLRRLENLHMRTLHILRILIDEIMYVIKYLVICIKTPFPILILSLAKKNEKV